MFVLASVSGAAHTLRDSGVHFVRHVELVLLLSKRIIHSPCPGCPAIGWWCARYRVRARIDSGSTSWML